MRQVNHLFRVAYGPHADLFVSLTWWTVPGLLTVREPPRAQAAAGRVPQGLPRARARRFRALSTVHVPRSDSALYLAC